MSDYFYAQINSNNIIVAVSQLAGEVIADHMIKIDSLDYSLLGVVYANGVFGTPPPPSLDTVKANKLAELQASRDAEIYSSFTSTALDGVTPKTYNSDADALANMEQKELQLLADTTIASVTWYNKEDGFVAHTRDQFLQLVKENANRIEGCKMKYFQLEPTVNAATDEAAVGAVTW